MECFVGGVVASGTVGVEPKRHWSAKAKDGRQERRTCIVIASFATFLMQ